MRKTELPKPTFYTYTLPATKYGIIPGMVYCVADHTPKNINDIKKYIINENVAVIIWSDNTKTISFRHEEDVFDKELGFLLAYFYKRWGRSKSATKRVLNTIDYSNLKIFLIEFFARDNEDILPYEKVKTYLKELKVEEK